MRFSEAYDWIVKSERRQRILLALTQPMTAKQLSYRTGLSLDTCSYILWELSVYELVKCLNPRARRSRLYWCSEFGKRCQEWLFQAKSLTSPKYDFPTVDWDLYGSVCFSHREAVIKTLGQCPLQPADIKRKAKAQFPNLRMSANNVRDVIRYFEASGIVRKVWERRKAHPTYELTEEGDKMRELLRRLR